MADSPQILMDERQAMAIDARASQLNGATQRENLGLAIKHDSVATIRKVGEDLVFTPDQLAFVISEIKKCRKDIVYFANTYFRIIGDGGLQVIKLYPKQEEMLRAMQRESRIIVLAPRQVGKCEFRSVNITIRNKKTGEIQTIPVEDFFRLIEGQNEKDGEKTDL